MNLPGIAEGVTHQGSLSFENLIAGEFPKVVRLATVTGGVPLTQGAVLGKATADGRYQLSDTSLTNGAAIPDAVLAHDVDTTNGDVQAHIILTGELNALALSFGAGHSVNSVTEPFRLRSIFLRNNQA